MEPREALRLAQQMQAAVGERAKRPAPAAVPDPLALFDAMVTEAELREETRQLFIDGHHSQAVEEGFKYLNNLVKRRTGNEADGAALMQSAFSLKEPLLRLSALKTQSQKDQQLGYMQMLAGAMTGVRNPRAHEHKYLDEPRNAIELLGLCNHLVRMVNGSTRTRRRSRS